MSSDISESSPLLSGRVDGGPWRISTDFIPSRIVCRVRRSKKGKRSFRSAAVGSSLSEIRSWLRSVANASLADGIRQLSFWLSV